MNICAVGWYTMPTSSVGIFKGVVAGDAARLGATSEIDVRESSDGGSWPRPGDWSNPGVPKGQVLLGVRLCGLFGRDGVAAEALDAITKDGASYGAAPYVRSRMW